MKPIVIAIKFCFFMLTAFCLCYCKKSNVPSNGLNIVLYNQPLSVIQQHIQGKWQLLYSKGGVATITQYYHNKFWEFDNDHVRFLDNNNLRVDTSIRWIHSDAAYTYRDSTYIMNFNDKLGYIYNYVVDRISNDTLILHEDASDAFFYRLVKSN